MKKTQKRLKKITTLNSTFFKVKFIEYVSKELNLSFKKSEKIWKNVEILAYNNQTDKYGWYSEDNIDFESEIKDHIEFMKSIFDGVLAN